jgi:hypothetical protein
MAVPAWLEHLDTSPVVVVAGVVLLSMSAVSVAFEIDTVSSSAWSAAVGLFALSLCIWLLVHWRR